jgi:hypothetical protein
VVEKKPEIKSRGGSNVQGFDGISITLTFLLLLFTTTSAYAQTYLFQVQSLDVNVYANTDGTSSIDYQIVFKTVQMPILLTMLTLAYPMIRTHFRTLALKLTAPVF